MATVDLRSLSVNNGDVLGGYTVILSGVYSSVTDTYSVLFGTEPATDVTVIDNNNISCVAPAHDQELLSITLTNDTESISSTLTNCFTFLNPGNTTLGLIRQQAQELADMVNSNFITTPEWNSYINQSYKELYDILVQKFGNDYFIAPPYSYTTVQNQIQYPLPTDFYKLMGVEVQLNAGNPNSWLTMKKFEFIDRNKYSYPNVYSFYGVSNLRYRLNGNNLMIMPLNQAGQTIRIWYTPRARQLTNDGSIVDGVSGWEEYIIADVCIKAWNKQESDVSVFAAQKMALLKRIEEAAEARDVGEAERVSDLKSINYGGNWGGGGNNTGGWY